MKKENLKALKVRLLALAMAATVTATMSGCSKSKETKNEFVGFSVQSSSFDTENGLYSHVINVKGLESEKYDYSSSLRTIRLAKIDEEIVYGTNIFNEQTTAFYRDKMILKWPECYSVYGIAWFNRSNFDCEIKIQKLKECAGSEYIVQYSSITAKRDFDLNVSMLGNGQNFIYKGDNMSSIAIFHNDELVAYKQTGVGSECENVMNATIGDVDIALNTIEDLDLLEETVELSYMDLYEYQEKLNESKEKIK